MRERQKWERNKNKKVRICTEEDKKKTRQWPADLFYTSVNKLPILALSLQLVTPKYNRDTHILFTIYISF